MWSIVAQLIQYIYIYIYIQYELPNRWYTIYWFKSPGNNSIKHPPHHHYIILYINIILSIKSHLYRFALTWPKLKYPQCAKLKKKHITHRQNMLEKTNARQETRLQFGYWSIESTVVVYQAIYCFYNVCKQRIWNRIFCLYIWLFCSTWAPLSDEMKKLEDYWWCAVNGWGGSDREENAYHAVIYNDTSCDECTEW